MLFLMGLKTPSGNIINYILFLPMLNIASNVAPKETVFD